MRHAGVVSAVQVSVRYWAGAQRAAGRERETVGAATLAELRDTLRARPAMSALAEIASFLVDGQQAGDDTPLADGAEVDVLPPFAGGAPENMRVTARVRGRVQGVGFRMWVARHAERLGVTGSATNLADGRVEVIAQGAAPSVDALVAALRGGGTPGYVETVDVEQGEPQPGETGFVTR